MASASITDLKTAAPAARPLATMKPKEQIAYLLNQRKGEIAKVLPKHLNPERLLKIAQVAATTTPKLLQCYIPTLVAAIGQCAQMGLEPNTVLGHAYLVPFWNTKKNRNDVQVIVGYKGLIDLARRSGQIVSISAHEVCENDEFDCRYGLNEVLDHKPAMGERGAVVAFYAMAKLKDGGHAFEVMSLKQIQEIAAGTQSKGKSGPWRDHFVEMGRKTVIRRLAKYLPLSIEFQTAAALDDLASSGKAQELDERTVDGQFTFVDDPEAAQDDAGGVDPDTGEIRGAGAPQALADDPSPTIPHHQREDRPTAEEMAAIEAQERGQAQPEPEPERRRQRQQRSID